MIHEYEIWKLMQIHMKPDNWYSVKEICQIIEENSKLDAEDLKPDYPNSKNPRPKWTRNVRNVLQGKKEEGDLRWDKSRRIYCINIGIDIKNVIDQKYNNVLANTEQTERQTIINQRIGQQIIREYLLSEYENKCAMCDIDHPDLLRVSHIIPWSENEETRLDVQNTLLLCGLHDLAFEKGFITINDNYAIIINTRAKGVKIILESITSKILRSPKSDSYFPKHEYLRIHRDKFRSP
jgi:predicted restriction endonuclease